MYSLYSNSSVVGLVEVILILYLPSWNGILNTTKSVTSNIPVTLLKELELFL